MIKKLFILAAACAGLTACGGGDNTIAGPPGGGTTTTTISSISVLTSSPQLLSDDSAPVTITARVLNAANQAMADVPVVIQTSSGVLTDVQTTTGSSGTATAVLHNSGDYTNRAVTVTATAGTVSDTVTVNVTGTRLIAPAATTIVQGSSTTSTITLVDAGGVGIPNEVVTVSSSSGNTLSSASLTTDVNGQASVTVTGTVAGADTLTVTALGMTATQTITVSNDSFAFTAPAANTNVNLGVPLTVTVRWTVGGAAQSSQVINFSTTRGTLSSSTATTDANGDATVTVTASNAGPAVITATTPTSTTVQIPVEFLATTPSSINLQANPTTIVTGAQSTITAVVRDVANNLVKNKTVVFTLTDVTGGTLSVGSAVTDSQGRAQTVYTASSSTSAANGVHIDGTVQGTTVSTSTTLTVARRELFISLGTGNEITEPSLAQYSVPYAIQVTDANGNGVANTALTVRVVSLWYGTGVRAFSGGLWTAVYNDVCIDEDSTPGTGYRNGILDLVNGVVGTGEDFNGTGRLEAGNIATVTPTTVTTDANGFALINVVYPQEYAYWVKVELSASTSVQGTESIRSVSFQLPGLADDFNDDTKAPPGPTSPFGTANYSCPTPSTFP